MTGHLVEDILGTEEHGNGKALSRSAHRRLDDGALLKRFSNSATSSAVIRATFVAGGHR